MATSKNTSSSSSTVPSALPGTFFSQFAQYDAKGSVDTKKSVKAFEEAFNTWLQEQAEIKPAVLAELAQHDRLGANNLFMFVAHRLSLKPTKETQDRISQAIDELVRAGKIKYMTGESGAKRGRNIGYVLAENANA